jgi:hypothetical protein
MAREIADFNGTVVAPSGTYPYGRVKDAPNGTVADETMIGDTIQFTQKLMGEAGVTPNGDPDNNSDGWQIYEAFEILSGRAAWNVIPASGGTATGYTAVGGGSVTVDAADRIYERVQLLGKTIRYTSQVRGAAISGTVGQIQVNVVALGGLTAAENTNGLYPLIVNGKVAGEVKLGANPVLFDLTYDGGTNPFPTGALDFDIDVTFEIA